MPEHLEQEILDWFSKHHSLEYLNLENTKPKLSDLANNLDYTLDRIYLTAKTSLSHFKLIQKTQIIQTDLLKQIQKEICSYHKTVRKGFTATEQVLQENKPVTITDIRKLVQEFSQTTKERETILLQKQLEEKIKQVEALLKEVKTFLTT